ncbi:alpha/beta hydrolase [Mycolicibacterium flavescens]|uniref:Lysophospholipase n=1 Tax=Mycolicibacterium flavescens TaxID=1776 RepID=A0A1E3RE34_MYCFV|nr:alpha/beta hydrolase [Mycolicibacterium flavescens]MCV7280768.1 alpha/beta hydrolase [Mycolicibacterium flavescens]ODQ88113.1 lysophospholipase [Mycolicibacterium flavescens]
MEYARYAAFVPAHHRPSPPIDPVSTWWSWRGRRVHIARAAVPDAPVRLLVVHGAGGYSGALWPIAAAVAREGIEVLSPDMPLYGDTVEPDPRSVRYPDWLDLLSDLVVAERAADPRPLVLFGASMGGMMAYEAAARTGEVAHVVATCLLDPAVPAARSAAARISAIGPVAPVLMRAVDSVLGRVRVPIRWLVDMNNMSHDAELTRLCAEDPKGGGVRVPVGFLASWLNHAHTAPESFTAAPVTLTHPGADRWTPPQLSIDFLRRIAGPTRLVMLDNCGHFPVEEPGLTQLAAALRDVRDDVIARTAAPTDRPASSAGPRPSPDRS